MCDDDVGCCGMMRMIVGSMFAGVKLCTHMLNANGGIVAVRAHGRAACWHSTVSAYRPLPGESSGTG